MAVGHKIKQTQMILCHLKAFGTITAWQAMREYGIMRLAARISDLRKEGVSIDSYMIHDVNRFGDRIHYSCYELKE